MEKFDNPVIIIAAARSGTKMLRELLGYSDLFIEFPFDINYVWLYGNYDKGHDELTIKDLDDKTKMFIKNYFLKLARNNNASRILEKSVPNSLRVSFVRRVFPEAQIIHLYRNGLDVAVDARHCWQSSMFSKSIQKKSDLFKKIISFPYISAWPYVSKYIKTNLLKLLFNQQHVKSWGPRYASIDEDVQNLDLLEVCGIQWAKSVMNSVGQLDETNQGEGYINIRYESLIENPSMEVKRICDFLSVPDCERVISKALTLVSDEYVGVYRKYLDKTSFERLIPHIESSLDLLGYQVEKYRIE